MCDGLVRLVERMLSGTSFCRLAILLEFPFLTCIHGSKDWSFPHAGDTEGRGAHGNKLPGDVSSWCVDCREFPGGLLNE